MSLDVVPVPPQPLSPNQVLIETYYVGIQYPDALQAQGKYQVRPTLPYIPAMDVSGIVRQVGSQVTHVQKGDRVLATLLEQGGTGAMAELVLAPASCVYPIPPSLHLSFCANIGRNYFAAYHSLKTIGKVGPDSLVLVDGASGGVGMATIELAKAMGAKVIAGVSTVEKMQYPLQLGADAVFSYGDNPQLFKKQVRECAKNLGHAQGVDLVVDMVQGDLFEKALISCVRPLGTIALVGFAAGQKPIRPGLLLIKEVNVVGSLWGRWAAQFPQDHQRHVHQILQYLSSGAISPRVDRIIPLANFIQAFELFETNQGRGNTVVAFKDEVEKRVEGGEVATSTLKAKL